MWLTSWFYSHTTPTPGTNHSFPPCWVWSEEPGGEGKCQGPGWDKVWVPFSCSILGEEEENSPPGPSVKTSLTSFLLQPVQKMTQRSPNWIGLSTPKCCGLISLRKSKEYMRMIRVRWSLLKASTEVIQDCAALWVGWGWEGTRGDRRWGAYLSGGFELSSALPQHRISHWI